MTFSAPTFHQTTASKTVATLVERMFTPRARRRYLDVRDLPDHLKRDLGVLDGKRPFGPAR